MLCVISISCNVSFSFILAHKLSCLPLTVDGFVRLAWDLLMFVFIAGLVFYVPLLIAYTSPLQSCFYLLTRGIDVNTAAVHVPPPGRSGVCGPQVFAYASRLPCQ